MGRLIEVQAPRKGPPRVTIQVGDVLLFQAFGGHVREGGKVVEMLGPFVQAILGDHGEVLTPQGPPNTVLVRALGPGRAVLDVITGNPFYETQTVAWTIMVGA
jgi:hypothetical protein